MGFLDRQVRTHALSSPRTHHTSIIIVRITPVWVINFPENVVWMARKKKEKPPAIGFRIVKYSGASGDPNKAGKMKLALPYIKTAVPVGTGVAKLRDKEREKKLHKLNRRKGKPPKGFVHKT